MDFLVRHVSYRKMKEEIIEADSEAEAMVKIEKRGLNWVDIIFPKPLVRVPY